MEIGKKGVFDVKNQYIDFEKLDKLAFWSAIVVLIGLNFGGVV